MIKTSMVPLDVDNEDNAPENTWKERVEHWKMKQEKVHGRNLDGGHPNGAIKHNEIDDNGGEDEESPMYV